MHSKRPGPCATMRSPVVYARCVSYIDPGNARSIALAERLGARPDPDAPRADPDDLVYRHTARRPP